MFILFAGTKIFYNCYGLVKAELIKSYRVVTKADFIVLMDL